MDIRYEHLKFSKGSEQEGEASPPPKGAPTGPAKDLKEFPAVSAELVDALDQLFPEQSPGANETHTQLMWRGGQRSIVRWLRAEHQAQLKGAT